MTYKVYGDLFMTCELSPAADLNVKCIAIMALVLTVIKANTLKRLNMLITINMWPRIYHYVPGKLL